MNKPLRQTLAAVLTSSAITLSGCSLSSTPSDVDTFTPNSAAISGIVHGGQQPIYNATINLYAAGSSGYGSASTLLATTKSDINGNFQFTPGTASTGITSSWQCPTTVPATNPQIYITAIGGNTQGTGVTTTNNTASALMAALGPCSSITSGTTVGLNEISTVATVFALAQYINPGTTPGTESVGTNAVNLTTGPAQSAIGLNNAVSSIANLANISIGQPITANTYTGTQTGVASVTVTATPESAKLITIANILAACINTAASSSTACSTLFTNANPPITASITSQPSATFATAQDTIQAAYYMATNPTDNTTAGAATLPATAGTPINNLFNLAGSTPPFGGGLTAQPSDWTLGVAYTATGNCANGGPFFNGPAYAAVDAKGNLWYINGDTGTGGTSSTYVNFAELSPIGQPLFCQTASSSAGRGITIDPTGNVWASFNGGVGAANSVFEVPAGTTSATSWPVPSTDAAYGIISDGNGNIYATSKGNGTTYGEVYIFPTPGTNTTPFPATLIASGFSSGLNSLTYSEIDGTGRLWLADTTASTPTIHEIAPPSAAITAFQIASNVVTFYSPATNITTGETVNITGLTTNAGLLLDHQTLTVTGITSGTSFTAATSNAATPLTTDSGLATVTNATTGYTVNNYSSSSTTTTSTPAFPGTSTNAYGLAIDSNNYVYIGDGCCGTTGASERTILKITTSAGVTGSVSYSQSAQSIAAINGVRSITLDGAANTWVSSWYPQQGDGNVGTPYGVSEFYTTGSGTSATFTPISSAGTKPTTCSTTISGDIDGCPYNGGYQKSSFASALDMEVDPSGDLWVLGTGSYSTPGNSTYYYNGTTITEIVGAAVPVVTPVSVAAHYGLQATKP